MLTGEEMESIRADVRVGLGSVCNLVSVERVKDARGQVTEATVTGPDFPCYIARVGEMEQAEVAGVSGAPAPIRVYYPPEVEIRAQDRVGIDVEGDTTILEVVAEPTLQTYAALGRVVCREMP